MNNNYLKLLLTFFLSGICIQLIGQTYINGYISRDTTWTKGGNPYIISGSLMVEENTILSLEPGVIVKPVNSSVGLYVFGTLKINGDAEDPVIFTSFSDDKYGGDSNGDGDLTSPQSGDWSSIDFYFPGKDNVIKNAWFGYGGGFPSKGTIYSKSLGLEIDSCTFFKSAKYAIYSTRSVSVENCLFSQNQNECIYLELPNASAEINLLKNTFSDNSDQPVKMYLDGTNVIINSKGNKSYGTGLNGITTVTRNLGNLTYNGDSLLPLIIDIGEVPLSTKFVLKAGSWIKFTKKQSRLSVSGTINSVGSETEPVVFTSIKNNQSDSLETDSLILPAPGDWDRVVIANSGHKNVLRNVEFRYGGSVEAMVTLYNTEIEIDSCIFKNSEKSGLHINFTTQVIAYSTMIENSENSGLKISNCTFSSNEINGVLLQGNKYSGKIELFNNRFFDNKYAVNANIRQIQYDIILNNNFAEGNFRNGFLVEGGIIGNIKMVNNPEFPFIINYLNVEPAGTLNLQPGTIFKFEQSAFGLEINGNFFPTGTEAEPVIFTSLKDDSNGGDTGGDGESIPLPGDWGQIYFQKSANNLILENCWFGYGNEVRVESGNTEIKNCTFKNFSQWGLNCNNTSPNIHNNRFLGNQKCGVYYNQVKTISLTDNYFENNQIPVIMNYDSLSWDIQAIDNQNTFAGTGIRGFGISGKITGDVTFYQNKTTPFVIYGLDIQPDAKLTFPAGGIYKFTEAGILVKGAIDISGSKEEPVFFTSVKDDVHGGDINGDGAETNPIRGDWGGISFYSNFNSKIAHLWLGYGGGEYSTGGALLSFNNSGRKNFGSLITVENCVITKSGSDGIWLRENSQPEIQNCKIFDNFEDGIHADHSQPVITNNEIYENGFYGVRNSTQQQNYYVDARNNYWGDNSGPFHSVKNPKGKGDYVSDFVLFDPYLKEPVIDWIIQKTNLNYLTEQIQIYPVPANHKVTFSVNLKSESQLKINLLSVEGKIIDVVLNELKPAGKSSIIYSVEELKNGIYFVEFIASQETLVRKLVVSNQIL